MGLPKFKDRFTVTQIFKTFEYETIDVESVEILIDEKKPEKKIKLKIIESFFTTFNFDDIDLLVVDIVTYIGNVKSRKIFDVIFTDFRQIYDSNKTIDMNGVYSLIEVSFDVSNFEIYQDDDLPTIESFIRDYKIKKITDIK